MSAGYWLEQLEKAGEGSFVQELRALLPGAMRERVTLRLATVTSARVALDQKGWIRRTARDNDRLRKIERVEEVLRAIQREEGWTS